MTALTYRRLNTTLGLIPSSEWGEPLGCNHAGEVPPPPFLFIDNKCADGWVGGGQDRAWS